MKPGERGGGKSSTKMCYEVGQNWWWLVLDPMGPSEEPYETQLRAVSSGD